MKISFTGVSRRTEFFQQNTGYGKLFGKLYQALKPSKYDIGLNDTSAAVAICCENPGWLYREGNQYTIGYTTHESTEMIPEWVQGLKNVDEIWTPSEFISEVVRKYTDKQVTTVPIFVDDEFTPVRREIGSTFFFLHIGDPSPRKGGSIVLECFQELFENVSNVALVLKSFGSTPNLMKANSLSNVIVLGSDYSQSEMNELYGKMHCLVYPTIGEGGGYIPLEAMCTGLPTISTAQWSDYKNYIQLQIDSSWVDIPQSIVESSFLRGNILNPSKESIKKLMMSAHQDYKIYEQSYSDQIKELKAQHSSTKIIEQIVIPRLQEIEKNYV